jgi:L-alanine-DL-glutamate epimerase-like enolase superfamily enzyme
VRFGRRLEAVRLEYLEDPEDRVAGLEQMATVRQRGDGPLCTNMCVIEFDRPHDRDDLARDRRHDQARRAGGRRRAQHEAEGEMLL